MRLPELDTNRIGYRFLGTTALDRFLDLPFSPLLFAEVDADLVEIASIFDDLSFPGLPSWDLAITSGGHEVLIRGIDSVDPSATIDGNPFTGFSWAPQRHAFGDPHGIYPLLKEMRQRINAVRRVRSRDLSDIEKVSPASYPEIIKRFGTIPASIAGILVARYPMIIPDDRIEEWHDSPELPPRFHRDLLSLILSGPWARDGLDLLYRHGYIDSVLPELAQMNRTEQSKEGHPEGNVWTHTLETLRYRKDRDILVGTALLFHDCGKPLATHTGGNRFDRHADIGADLTGDVLDRLGYDEPFVSNVQWLVRYHMMPGALRRLPDHRRDPLMRSDLFPVLLEVYRCDLSSTFRGPNNYYEACAVYKRFLKTKGRSTSRSQRQRTKFYVE